MKERLRLATQEEITRIAPEADLGPNCVVLALDTPAGPILTVIRHCVEADPVIFPDGCEDRYKLVAMRDVETFLFSRDIQSYYFNILESDAQWRKVAEHFGASATSKAPEIRFKKVLNVN